MRHIVVLKRIALVYAKSGSGPTMDTHEFINYEPWFDLNNTDYLSRKKL